MFSSLSAASICGHRGRHRRNAVIHAKGLCLKAYLNSCDECPRDALVSLLAILMKVCLIPDTVGNFFLRSFQFFCPAAHPKAVHPKESVPKTLFSVP